MLAAVVAAERLSVVLVVEPVTGELFRRRHFVDVVRRPDLHTATTIINLMRFLLSVTSLMSCDISVPYFHIYSYCNSVLSSNVSSISTPVLFNMLFLISVWVEFFSCPKYRFSSRCSSVSVSLYKVYTVHTLQITNILLPIDSPTFMGTFRSRITRISLVKCVTLSVEISSNMLSSARILGNQYILGA